jgi:hypothetical protein
MSPIALRIGMTLIVGLMISACGMFGAEEPTPIGDGKAPAAGTAYPAPGSTATVAPTTGATAAAPTVAPPPAGSGSQSLVGSEWTLLASGDLNGDTKADVVAIKLTQGVTPDASFRQPPYSAYKGPASEMVIVQAGDDGRPQIQTVLTGGGLSAGGVGLLSFGSAAGYMVYVTPGASPLVSIRAINAAGTPLGATAGLVWNGSRYALYQAPIGK